ncbi:hypothetical protein [Deinococcus hopiensis]|uniref:hypothetical protein n=1 Tax=Deinococcus hopiensis TaxID=309885 RepID=UPI00111C0157|nr:hypothetical protein [Deinococcus hopiensis]
MATADTSITGNWASPLVLSLERQSVYSTRTLLAAQNPHILKRRWTAPLASTQASPLARQQDDRCDRQRGGDR